MMTLVFNLFSQFNNRNKIIHLCEAATPDPTLDTEQMKNDQYSNGLDFNDADMVNLVIMSSSRKTLKKEDLADLVMYVRRAAAEQVTLLFENQFPGYDFRY